MFIQAGILILLAIVAGLITFLIGFIGWIILSYMKAMLHLDITIETGKKESDQSE